jgi:oxygen-independent coproporphyrinogen-3 oxidase
MKLELNGKINGTYVQTLCAMFFHGEKFPKDSSNETKTLKVSTTDTENGIICNCEFNIDGKNSIGYGYCAFSADETYERTSKTAVGKAVYEAGVKLTGKTIPWGILTGIRPSKVANELILKHGEQKALEILMDRYLLSIEKATLAIKVAKNEYSILSLGKDNTCSVYISIPFCPSRCTYCSFISYATPKLYSLIPKYLNKLILDIKATFDEIKNQGLSVISIYIGGGTPTTLDENQLELLLSEISKHIDTNILLEFTLEAGRPDTITEGKLSIAKKYGVNRISINPQTLNDNVLKLIGRRHTAGQFLDAYDLVSNSGIKHINTDLIAGLEGDTFESFKKTVDKILELNPDNITVHSFCVKKSAQVLRDNESIYDKYDLDAIKSVKYAYDTLTQNGYEPYYMYRQKNTVSDLENVGYAKKDAFGIYNVLMMADAHTVYGIGAGATTKIVKNDNGILEINRIFSPKYPYEYLQDKQ